MGDVIQVIHKVLIVTVDDLDRGTHIGIAAIRRAVVINNIDALPDKVDKSNHFPLRNSGMSTIKPSRSHDPTMIHLYRGFGQFASCLPNDSIPIGSFPISSINTT